MSEPSKAPASPTDSVVKFIHQESRDFRTAHVDGVWGDINAYGTLHLSFFSERPPMPKSVSVQFGSDGVPKMNTQVVEESTDASVVRQLEINLSMSLNTAKTVHASLGNFITILEQMPNRQQKLK